MRADWVCVVLGLSLSFCAAADEALSSDFLEFLGNGSQLGEEWIDPLSLHDDPEVFASLPPAEEDSEGKGTGHDRESVAPADNTSKTSHDDGGHNHD